METKEDRSFGVIPVFKNDKGDCYFCLVREDDGHWGFPKGHPEENETEAQTAKRELKEETGIEDFTFYAEPVFVEEYSFVRDGFQYNKSVKYFLGLAHTVATETSTDFKKEILGSRWLTCEEARKLITFPEAKEVLDQARKYLQSC